MQISRQAPPGNYWNSAAWHWNDTAALYTKHYGEPLGVATRQGDVWTRSYQHAAFRVDCATLAAERVNVDFQDPIAGHRAAEGRQRTAAHPRL